MKFSKKKMAMIQWSVDGFSSSSSSSDDGRVISSDDVGGVWFGR